MTEIFLEIIILAAALSVDAFAVSFSYGLNRTRLPLSSILILTCLSVLSLSVSLLAGRFLHGLLPEKPAAAFRFLILFLLGVFKLLDSSAKGRVEAADKNRDDRLSPLEALPLGAALSVDSLGAGIGAGIAPSWFLPTLTVSFLLGIGAILAGSFVGQSLSLRSSCRFDWLGGLLLILLAFLKL